MSDQTKKIDTHRTGFTLLELLAAMGILVLLVAMLGRMFIQSMELWDRGTTRTDVNLAARAALQLMQRELAMAVVSDEIGMRVASDRITFVSLIGGGANSPYERSAVELDERSRSAVELEYFVAETSDIATGSGISGRFSLYRRHNEGAPQILRAGPAWWRSVPENDWSTREQILANVHDVEFIYWHLDPIDEEGGVRRDGLDLQPADFETGDLPPPALIEIRLRVIDPKVADRWEFLEPEQRDAGIYTFSTQVRVRNSDIP